MSINKVILVGNVGKDPVVRYFDKGVAMSHFPAWQQVKLIPISRVKQ